MTADCGWELFPHGADVGVRGRGDSLAAAFEGVAMALTAVVTVPDRVQEREAVEITCRSVDSEILLYDWLNAIIHEMAVRGMLFGRFQVEIEGERLKGTAWGEPVAVARHQPASEIKGATFTELAVRRLVDGRWEVQCVVDV
ncbi:MAG: archease [Alphaproteobacteria bacterium]|nr:archease [Alphaproteobacteria bacterium]